MLRVMLCFEPVQCNIVRIITADGYTAIVRKDFYRSPGQAENILHGLLDLTGLHPVAVYLDHIIDSSKDHEVSVRKLPSHVSGVVDPSPEGFFIFLRKIPVSPEVRVFKAYLTDHSGRYPFALLIQGSRALCLGTGVCRQACGHKPCLF